MERKKTILIAVFINAGLLAVLFIAALTMQEDKQGSPNVADSLLEQDLPKLPLYTEEMNTFALSGGASQKSEEFPTLPLLQLPITEPKSKPAEPPILHNLPPVVAVEPPASPAPFSPSSFTEIVVKKGDSLEKIAKGHHVTVDEIIRLNRLPNHDLKIGQVLQLPKEKNLAIISKPKEMISQDYYTVKVGDNPWTIAMKHHIKVEELLRINGLNEQKARKLKPGDRLRIR